MPVKEQGRPQDRPKSKTMTMQLYPPAAQPSTLSMILKRLPDAKPTGEGKWRARCPAHDDHNPSLEITLDSNGNPRLKCWAGCPPEKICQALGIARQEPAAQVGHLGDVGNVGNLGDLAPARSNRKTYATRGEAIRAAAQQVKATATEGVWPYLDSSNREVFHMVRFKTPSGKAYRPIRPTHDGFKIEYPPGPLPLLFLPLVNVARRVFVVEGEKAADAGRRIGLSCTTSAGGANGVSKTDWTPLAGRQVMILPDNDEPGRQYAQKVAGILRGLDPPPTVKIVELPGLPDKGDLSDFIKDKRNQGKSDEAIRNELMRLADEAQPFDGAVLIRLDQVKPEQVRWLWPGRIPLGKVTLLVGDPGVGKSLLTLDIAARVTKERGWPDHPDSQAPVGSVVLLNAEDDIADTIRPRLDAADAEPKRIRILRAVRNQGQDQPFRLDRDLPRLRQAIQQTPDTKLVVIDPISAYLGRSDPHKDAELRELLSPMAELAEQLGVAILVVTHLNKRIDTPAIYRAMGSQAFVAVARAVWGVVLDNQEPDRRLLLPLKNNLVPGNAGLAFTIAEPGKIEWEPGPVTMTMDEALGAAEPSRARSRKQDEAAAWLKGMLTKGPVEAKAILAEGEQAGFPERTLQRAKKELGVISRKDGARGVWLWALPSQDGQGCQDCQGSQRAELELDGQSA